MHSIYIVDDEPLVLEELVSNPLFEECGFQIAGSQTNPFKAAKEIKRLSPDVVFTDLKMPECSGVDMMDELRKKGADCEFVVISAYAEFEESRRFFRLSGFDYLLKPVSNENLQQILGRLAAKIAGKKTGQESHSDTPSPELNEMIAYLRENVGAKHSLESLSEKYSTNSSYICQLFSNYLGATFTAYMTGLRMEAAAGLLRDTKKDVKEIAGLCGYSDYFYFCRVFRKHYLCTPTVFREETR